MSDEQKVKPCPFCELMPDKHTCPGMFDLYDCPAGHTGQLTLKSWNTRENPSPGMVALDEAELRWFVNANCMKESHYGVLNAKEADELAEKICKKFGVPAQAEVPAVTEEELVNTIKTTNISIEGQKALDRGEAVVICMKDIFKISQAILALLKQKGSSQ